jgi:two-component system response regulator YesN
VVNRGADIIQVDRCKGEDMIKVVIADDEEKVCQLICNLIDWKSINMEIVGIAHNGIEALELVKTLKPNLMITDIRMPGYDGLELISYIKEVDPKVECIIISGYRHFEYAQNAIKYGVFDYLLKPIKKDELLSTLAKMNEKFRLRTEKLSNEERLKISIQNNIDKLRSGLFTEILLQKKCDLEEFTLSKINENYHFKFESGCFQAAIVKVDCGFDEGYNSSIKLLQDKIAQILSVNLKDKCFDMDIHHDDSIVYLVLNYMQENRKIIRKQLKMVLDELLIQKNVFEQVEFTIGLGTIVEDIRQLSDSFKMAHLAMEQRLVVGTGKLIEEIKVIDTQPITNRLLAELNKSMEASLEILDKDGVLNSIAELRTSIKSADHFRGAEVFKLVKEACNIYLVLLRNRELILSNNDEFYENFCLYANRCGSVEEVFRYLTIRIEESLDQMIEDKKYADTKPIRMAKKYIQQNSMKPISLEEVSSYVGFNASYFSTLFKKESGSNFLEYLSEVRMNHAKELLKETNISIAEICEKVGYSDLKHFTKSFKKATGLKPNEYRKLYS